MITFKEQHPILKLPGAEERINSYVNAYSPASVGMPCFDCDYEVIAKHIKTLPMIQTITDIGCAWGIQSLFFEDYVYIGLDARKAEGIDAENREFYFIPFFEEGQPNRKYYVGTFPKDLTDEMIGDCFISNMSVGYGSLGGATDEDIAEAFMRFDCGYIRGDEKVSKIVREAFPYHKPLIVEEKLETLWFVSKSEID